MGIYTAMESMTEEEAEEQQRRGGNPLLGALADD